MNKHSIIFIEEGKEEGYERLSRETRWERCLRLLVVPPRELPLRVASAFLPPLFGPFSRKVYVDLVGPLLAVALLAVVLHLGHASKELPLSTPPSTLLFFYLLAIPGAVGQGARLGGSRLTFPQILSLLGYALYGTLFTVTTSLFVPPVSANNTVFFLALLLFGGLTSFRVSIILLVTIPKPAARLLICSLVNIYHLLFIIFIHFAYMHKTFVYGKRL